MNKKVSKRILLTTWFCVGTWLTVEILDGMDKAEARRSQPNYSTEQVHVRYGEENNMVDFETDSRFKEFAEKQKAEQEQWEREKERERQEREEQERIEEEKRLEPYVDWEEMVDGVPFRFSLNVGDDLERNNALCIGYEGKPLRSDDTLISLPLSGVYEVTLVENNTGNDDVRFKVKVSSLGGVVEKRSSEKRSDGWKVLALGETDTMYIDHYDTLQVDEGYVLEFKLIEYFEQAN